MIIHKDFPGGNIHVVEQTGSEVILENELRDTTGDWFYWAFCVENAENTEVTFRFLVDIRVGHWGPAVSHDLKTWHWLDSVDGESFTYRFAAGENRVYFAHHMLYHPERFFAFAKQYNLEVGELCKSKKGRSVPYVSFGSGSNHVLLAARNHACESTGNYVLEGVLTSLLLEPMEDMRIFCVPFVDYDGVVDGDQGKSRYPHDHNRDYTSAETAIYPEVAQILRYADTHSIRYAFDFHSPFHKRRRNDYIFIVRKLKEMQLNQFSEELKNAVTPSSMQYSGEWDVPLNTEWNVLGTGFSSNMSRRPECDLSFTLESTYFGNPQDRISQEKLVELGKCFAKAFRSYHKKQNAI